MQIYSYRKRVTPLLSSAIKLGAAYGFFASLIYTLILFLLFSLSGVSAAPSSPYDSAASGPFIITMLIGILTVIPSTIIGIVGGILVAAILALWKKRVESILASLIGLVVGIIIMLIVNYIIWRNIWQTFISAGTSHQDFFKFLIDDSPFFIPTVIAILLSTMGAWQINRKERLESSAG